MLNKSHSTVLFYGCMGAISKIMFSEIVGFLKIKTCLTTVKTSLAIYEFYLKHFALIHTVFFLLQFKGKITIYRRYFFLNDK